jgi:hypothetical protein
MLRKILILFLILCVIASCAKKQSDENEQGSFSGSAISKRQEVKYLAYEHFITVDVKEEKLSQAYETTIDECLNDKKNNCTILDSEQRLKMLESHRDRLLLLQKKAGDDIESLIKVSSELSEV